MKLRRGGSELQQHDRPCGQTAQDAELKEAAGERWIEEPGTQLLCGAVTFSEGIAASGTCRYRREAARTRARQNATEMDNQEIITKAMEKKTSKKNAFRLIT